MAHIDCSFYSNSLKKNAHVIVFVPTVSADDYLEERKVDYYSAEKKFPVLYLLHGSYGDCMDWPRLTGIERYAQEKGIAVVMPSAENSSYVNMEAGEAYLTYISEELPEFMCKMFPFSRKREDTYIAGLSMGGYGTYRCALEHPEKYGCAASLSGGLDQEVMKSVKLPHKGKMSASYVKAVNLESDSDNQLGNLLEKRISEKADLPKLYMVSGTEDPITPSGDAFYEKAKELGVEITYEKHPGIHDWNFWDTYIKDVLEWISPKA